MKFIANPSAGSDHIDLEFCREKGIVVKGLRGRVTITENIYASAEFSFILMAALIRKIPEAVSSARKGHWREIEEDLRGLELHGKVLGLVGYGRIGKK